ncbi:hypothetical protein BOX15_Mlig001185g3, partial [Macrostomum lignano]
MSGLEVAAFGVLFVFVVSGIVYLLFKRAPGHKEVMGAALSSGAAASSSKKDANKKKTNK